MALVDSDLFLVQDASTKANYKLSFENLTKEIALDIDLDTVYVEVDGDNMLGDLTLGPAGDPKITLTAASGDATFAGDIYADYARITNRIDGANGLLIYGDLSAPTGIELASNGDINIGGKLTIGGELTVTGDSTFGNIEADLFTGAFAGDGSLITNLPVESGLWEQTGNNLSPLAASSNLVSIVDITATGTIEANKIDGGTYT